MLHGRRIGTPLTMMLAGALLALSVTASAEARDLPGALLGSSDCTRTELPRNDDGFGPQVDIGFSLDFYGQSYSRLWVNNNGNVTFDAPLSTYTPFGLQATSRAIVAPFFADVDTRAGGSDIVRYGYGSTTYEGRPAFCVNWVDVGYYNARSDKLNSFQVLLVDRSDVRSGDFDIVFNYGSIVWETGDASGGSNGLGGESARVGFANGDGTTANSFELPGSGIDGSLLDSSPRGLIRAPADRASPVATSTRSATGGRARRATSPWATPTSPVRAQATTTPPPTAAMSISLDRALSAAPRRSRGAETSA